MLGERRSRLVVIMLLLVILLVLPNAIPITRGGSPETSILRPNAPGTYTEWTTVYPAGIPHWDAVDDVTADDDGSYIETATKGHRDTFHLPDIPSGASVSTVKVYVRHMRGEPSAKLRIMIRTYSNDYISPSITAGTTWTTSSYNWTTNPYTGTNWTVAEVNALEAGVQTSGAKRVRVTQVYVEVIYTLPPVAPIASFTYSPSNPFVYETITFNASASYDPDGNIVSYEWDFGDGNITTVTDPIITHIYTTANSTVTFTVTLTVTDNEGLTNSTTDTVAVVNPSVLHISLPAGTYVGPNPDHWLSQCWLLNITGLSGTFTIRINNTAAGITSYDTHLIIALNNASYEYLDSLTVDTTTIPKTAFIYGVPKPYGFAVTWEEDVYPTWFNYSHVVGTVDPKSYEDVNVSVTFSNAAGVRMHFDAYGSTDSSPPPTSMGHITHNPHQKDSTVLFWPPVNTPPVASDLAISPPSPVTVDDLVGSYTYYDLEDNLESGTEIRWYKDGVLQPTYNDTLTIPSGETAKGQEWYFTVRPKDGMDFGDLQTSPTVVIGNSPPTAPVVDVTPDSPVTTDNLVCTITTPSTDPDGETITYTYAWYKNDALQLAYTTNTVPASATTNGEVWKCVVTPYDGTDYGPSDEDQVTIGNRPPYAYDLTLTPSNPLTTDNLVASYSYADPDTDPESGSEIRWYKNGVLQPAYNDQTIIPSSATAKGETWYFTVRPKDGTDFGNIQTSPSVTIQNSAPTATNLAITPSTPYTTDDLVGSYDYSDPDNDPESGSEIRWYKNGVLQPAYNDLLLVPSTATAKGEEWYFTIKPKDGTTFGEIQTSSPVIIQNSPPVLNPIGSKSVSEGVLLEFTINALDPDGDPLTYSASNLPPGATFDINTHVFSWTPTPGQAGTYPDVHFEVTDGYLTDSENITITVSPPLAVGGYILPVDKLSLLAPSIGLISALMAVMIVTITLSKHKRKH